LLISRFGDLIVCWPAFQPNDLIFLQAKLAGLLIKIRRSKIHVGKTAPRADEMEFPCESHGIAPLNSRLLSIVPRVRKFRERIVLGDLLPRWDVENQDMDENRVEGAARNLGGKVQDAVGAVTGDAATQMRGQMNRATGAAQNAYGQTVDGVRDFTTDQPLIALVSALGIGVIIGLLLGRD
jgi:uncharacterized protein YjbJ (UPF0337 family)